MKYSTTIYTWKVGKKSSEYEKKHFGMVERRHIGTVDLREILKPGMGCKVEFVKHGRYSLGGVESWRALMKSNGRIISKKIS